MKTDNLAVVLCCAGRGERWGNYKDVPKHLAPVTDQPLIHRTVDQLSRIIKPRRCIYLVGSDERLQREPAILVPPAVTFNPLPGSCLGECAAAMHNGASDYLLLMGDIFWSEAALKQLLGLGGGRIEFFGRPQSDGEHNPEIYGAHIPFFELHVWWDALEYVRTHYVHTEAAGWQVYRHIQGIPLTDHRMGQGFVEITEPALDIDSPQDFIHLKRNEHTY